MTNLNKSAEFGKAALTIAAALIVPGSIATSLVVAGESAGFLINCINWDKEKNNRIATAVKKALRQVRENVPHGAKRIVDELIDSVNSPFSLEERIKRTENYLLQFETPKTQRNIAEKFQSHFRTEISHYPDLQLFIGIFDGLSTLLGSFDHRIQYHSSVLSNQEQMITVLRAEMELLKKEPMLCLPGTTPGVKLIGRESDLANFIQEVATGSKVCVVSGIGGVGKTEFIKMYLQVHKDTIGRVGWFEYRGNFRETLLAISGLVLATCAPKDDPQARYNEIVGLLRQMKAEDLLAFDNVGKVESSEDIDAILALPCRVIFTTRDTFTEDRNRLLIYNMAFLSIEACEALFAHYRQEETPPAEREGLLEVIRLAGQHTMALELIAKTCMVAGLTVGDLLEKLNKDGFNLDGLKEEVRREGGRENKRFLDHMLKLYNIADISAMGGEAEWLLANLSILPLQNFDIKVLIRWLDLPNRVLLNQLNDRGWIRIGLGDKVTMHSVIAEVIRAELKPDAERCEKLIYSVHKSICYTKTDMDIFQAPYLNYAKSILKHLIGETERVADLFSQVSYVQHTQGDYEGGLSTSLRAMAIRETVLGREHLDTASSYNNLAASYQEKGNYENALNYFKLAIIATVVWCTMPIIIGFIAVKNIAFRRLIDGEPKVVIQNGIIINKNMLKEKYNMGDLLMQLRDNSVFDITEIEFAILEPNSNLSVLKKSQYNPVTPKDMNIPTNYKGIMTELIIDGRIISQHLKIANKDEKWLLDQLKSKNIDNINNVVFAGLQTDGQLYISLKTDSTGTHSIF